MRFRRVLSRVGWQVGPWNVFVESTRAFATDEAVREQDERFTEARSRGCDDAAAS